MKKYLIILLAALCTLSFSANAQNKKEKSKLEEVTFVTTIDCNNCVKK